MKRLSHILLTGLALAFLSCTTDQPPGEKEEINVVQALSDTRETACYTKAESVIDFQFPRDNGPHPDFRTEWWYYTGNLETPEGEHLGFQLTFFRQALACETAPGPSPWRTRQLYFAHFAVTHTTTNQFHAAVRMTRGSLGLAGAHPHRVWIDDWQARARGQDAPPSPIPNQAMVLTARDHTEDGRPFALELTLEKPERIIRQGNRGLSAKGPGQGNASYYYSLPRLKSRGWIQIGNKKMKVSGLTWFDHEWSTTALGKEVGGWDWFAAHLDDGRDLMVCRVRRADGSANGYGFGSLVSPRGKVKILTGGDFTLTPLAHWTSPATGTRYPSQWEIQLEKEGLELRVTPVIPNQEHRHSFAYWEGAVLLESLESDGPSGRGYAELTGY